MKNNAVVAYNGVEIYTDKIHELADEYLTCELSEERRQEIYNNSSMLININPGTLSRWSSGEYRTNIYYDSKGNYIKDFAAWQLNHQGEKYRVEPSTAHSQAVKKWKDICKTF